MTKQFFIILVLGTLACSLRAGSFNPVELNNIGFYLEQTLSNGNPAYFNQLFDKEALLDNILFNSKNKQIKHYNLGFRNGFYNSFDLGNIVLLQLGSGSTYSFIKAYQREGKNLLLFRSFTNDGINYHEYVVDGKEDNYRIVDMYVYLSGEYISERLRRTYRTNLVKLLPEEAAIFLSDKDYQAYALLDKARVLLEKGNDKKAFKTWEKIQPSSETERAVQLTGIQIASFYNIELYNQLCLKYERKFPEDPGFYLFSANGLYAQQSFNNSLRCIDSLDHKVGTDPLLDYLRGGIYAEMGELGAASKAYHRLINNMPAFEPGYLSLFEVYISQNDFTKATSLLEKMSTEFNYYKEDFSDYLQDFPNYIQSDEYNSWIKQ